MKKNELIIARTFRACTADERDHLQQQLKIVATPRKRQLKAILNVLVLWGCLLFSLLLLSGLLNYLATNNNILSALLAFSGLQEIAIITTGIYALFSTYQWLQKWDNPYPSLRQDLHNDHIMEETYLLQDVCRFQETQLGGFIYFLKISDNCVFVLYDYHSQGDALSPLIIQNKLILSRAPNSGVYLNQRFEGKELLVTSTNIINLPPEKWPLADTWFPHPWSQLHAQLSSSAT